jgi:hypothetical protein
MKAAVTVMKKEMGSFKVSCILRVPQTTPERDVKLESSSANRIELKLCRKPVLPPSLEDAVEHCI